MKHLLNGKGYKEYKSKKAQIKFAESLIAIGAALFITGLSPIMNYVLGGSITSSIGMLWITGIGILLGAFFRDKGLKIIDEIESKP